MGRSLYYMSWEEIQKEMSIAGSPEKITALGRQVMTLIGTSIDATNRAELTNVELMLKVVMAEIRGAQRRYDRSKKL